MQRLNDEDLARETLIGCKLMSEMYTDAALESADPAFMELFDKLHHEHIASAHRIWEWLNRHGAYPARQAHGQDVEETRRFLSQLVREAEQFCQHAEHARRGSAEPYPRPANGDWNRGYEGRGGSLPPGGYGTGGWGERDPAGYRR